MEKINPKYNKTCRPGIIIDGKAQPVVIIDVYDVEKTFEVGTPPMRHALKKILAGGKRGHKSYRQDVMDVITAANRELMELDAEEQRAHGPVECTPVAPTMPCTHYDLDTEECKKFSLVDCEGHIPTCEHYYAVK